MKYFLFTADVENYSAIGPDDESFWSFFLDDFDSSHSLEASWKIIDVVSVTDDLEEMPSSSYADILNFNLTPILAFTLKAFNKVGHLFSKSGEFLPLRMKGEKLYVYHCTNVLNVLDENRSQIERFSTGRIMNIVDYKLKLDELDSVDVFRIEGDKWKVFVSEEVVKEISISGLKGGSFEFIDGV